MTHAGDKFSPAWVYLHAARAGLTRREAAYLPWGAVQDQIAAWMIEEHGFKQRSAARDIFDF